MSAPAERYVVTLGAIVCLHAEGFAAKPSRCFDVVTVPWGGFRLTIAGDARGVVCNRIVIPPSIRYSVGEPSAELCRFLVEPVSNVGRRLRYDLGLTGSRSVGAWADSGRRLVDPASASAVRRGTWQEVVRKTFARVDPPAAPNASDLALLRRIAEAIDHDLGGRLATTTVAAQVGERREALSRVLSSLVGLPLRPFLQWYRLLQFARFVERGDSPERASRATGFGGFTKLTAFSESFFGLGKLELGAIERWSAAADALV